MRNLKKGFTLAEVMIVLTVIGVLTAILLPVARQSMPDENLMKFKKAHNTLGTVIRELVTSDKYYRDGDLGVKPNSSLVDSATYFCETIADVLNMTVEEAYRFFINVPKIARKLELLKRVGLDYIKLGQSSLDLSGGEAQRIKLSKELAARSTGETIYILDEPTTGLHFEDIKLLLSVLHELVEQGNTVIVIEHNLEVIKTADWIIDLGPTGGAGGGQIIATGTPEDIVTIAESKTGKYLHKYLDNSGKGNKIVKQKKE